MRSGTEVFVGMLVFFGYLGLSIGLAIFNSFVFEHVWVLRFLVWDLIYGNIVMSVFHVYLLSD